MEILDLLKIVQDKGFSVKWDSSTATLQVLTGQKDESAHIGKISVVNAALVKIRFPLRIAIIQLGQIREISYSSLDESKIF